MATRTEVYIGRKNQTPGLNVGMHFLLITPKQHRTATMHNICRVLDMLSNAQRISSLQEAVPRFFVTTVMFYIRCSVLLDSDIPHTLEAVTHRYHEKLGYSSGVFPSKVVTTFGLGSWHTVRSHPF